MRRCIANGGEDSFLSFEQKGSRRRLVNARQYFDQCRFTRAVLSNQSPNPAAPNPDTDTVERNRTRINPGYVSRLENCLRPGSHGRFPYTANWIGIASRTGGLHGACAAKVAMKSTVRPRMGCDATGFSTDFRTMSFNALPASAY